MPGLLGRLFREFAETLSITIIISLIISLTMTPMLCAMFLRARCGAGKACQTGLSEAWNSGFNAAAGSLSNVAGIGAPPYLDCSRRPFYC